MPDAEVTGRPASLPEILTLLTANADVVAGYFASLPGDRAFTGDSDHWSPAHHLVHLTRVCRSITAGLRHGQLPAHSTGRSRAYAEVRDGAAVALAAAPKERLLTMGRTVELPAGADMEALVGAYRDAAAAMRTAAAGWPEDELDRRAMPHPLMGELTVREMLLFVVVHERHHLRGVGYRKPGSSASA